MTRTPPPPMGPVERVLTASLLGSLVAGVIASITGVSAHSGTMLALLISCSVGTYWLLVRRERNR